PDNPAAEQSAQAYIQRMLQVPEELRAKAIFAGLEAVADDLPAPDDAPETATATATAAAAAPITPAVVDVTTHAVSGAPLEKQTEPQEPVASPASAPTPAPAAAAQPEAMADGPRAYYVQLGAYPNQQLAAKGWGELVAVAPALL